ncbi:MAG: GNVR domain-containing protein, partial [Candidatus Acidiferrales bacterium]
QVELEGVQDGLNRAQQNNILIQDSLQSGEITLASMVRIAQEKNVGSGAAAPGPGDQPTSVPQLEAKLSELEMTYTSDYPEVQKVKALLAAARAKAAKLQAQDQSTQKKSAKTAQPLSPGVSNLEIAEIDDPTVAATLAKERERLADLKAQKAVIAKQIASYNDQRKKILAQIDNVQARVDHLPVTEQQLAAVTRDYQITKANYKSLLDKKLAAGMAADMEKRQKSEHFALLDPARVPQIPFKPNRPLVAAIGGFLSLLIAAAFALGRAVQENMILGDWELPKDVPILGHIPVIPAIGANRSRFAWPGRKAATGFAVGLLGLAIVAGLSMGIYLHWI